MRALEEAGLKLNLKKCLFNVNSVPFCGRIIDGKTKKTKEESIEKVKRMKKPFDVHSLRCFTGLTGHFRAFISKYADIVRPLDRLKQKDVPFEWTEQCEKSYQQLVDIISQNPILQSPDSRLPYELCCDASHYGTGSILYQRDSTQKKPLQLRVIGYQSHTFTKAEQNYTVTEKEGLAVIKAIKYFRGYLEGKQFIVHTDHQALTYILTLKEPKGRIGRWQTFLMSYNLRLNHRSGRELVDADALSRLCPNTETEVNLVKGVMEGKKYQNR